MWGLESSLGQRHQRRVRVPSVCNKGRVGPPRPREPTKHIRAGQTHPVGGVIDGSANRFRGGLLDVHATRHEAGHMRTALPSIAHIAQADRQVRRTTSRISVELLPLVRQPTIPESYAP